LNLRKYADLTQNIDFKLDEADIASKKNDVRYEHKAIFKRLKNRIKLMNKD
jgi:hypothetical protein